MEIQPGTVEETDDAIRKKEARRAQQLANLKPIQKGEVRNPRGRPKKDMVLADMAQKHAEKAISTLLDVMTDTEASPSARVSAASELLDRGFGRAPQSLDVEHKLTLSQQFEDLLLEITGERRSRLAIEAEIVEAAE